MPAVPVQTNRLGREKSPYLLQHQHNPVDWFPWGQEAFAKARQENKPIFLSIGYSTCHWCHVMERESFEDRKTADYLNAHFVSIKVDREERPDVDKIYMTAVQALSRQGGWPLNCFLTPELKPFYGGTYFPPENKHGMASFIEVLRRIAQLWENRRDKIQETASDFHQQLAAVAAREPGNLPLSPALLDNAAAVFKQEYDPAKRTSVSVGPCGALQGRGRSENGASHLRADGGGWHLRPSRRRVCPLFGGRAMVGAAFREDALR
jgi:hypothetical protein